MAHIRHYPKPGNNWRDVDLFAYNIKVVEEDVATFFGTPNLPASTVDPVILNNVEKPPGPISKSSRLFFRYLESALVRGPSGLPREWAVNQFISYLLGLLDYDALANRCIYRKQELFLNMCGKRVNVKSRICLMDNNDLIQLVVQGDGSEDFVDSEPQLVVAALAAFYSNHYRLIGIQPPLQVIHGINLLGTFPTFYKIPVTADLMRSLQIHELPPPVQQTTVHKLIPHLPDVISMSFRDPMESLENRHHILQCFEAFKRFI